MSLEVRLRCVISDELFLELGHRERPAVLEACHELAVISEDQILAVLLEVVFGELIHCLKYIGTVISCQAQSAEEGAQSWWTTLP